MATQAENPMDIPQVRDLKEISRIFPKEGNSATYNKMI